MPQPPNHQRTQLQVAPCSLSLLSSLFDILDRSLIDSIQYSYPNSMQSGAAVAILTSVAGNNSLKDVRINLSNNELGVQGAANIAQVGSSFQYISPPKTF